MEATLQLLYWAQNPLTGFVSVKYINKMDNILQQDPTHQSANENDNDDICCPSSYTGYFTLWERTSSRREFGKCLKNLPTETSWAPQYSPLLCFIKK